MPHALPSSACLVRHACALAFAVPERSAHPLAGPAPFADATMSAATGPGRRVGCRRSVRFAAILGGAVLALGLAGAAMPTWAQSGAAGRVTPPANTPPPQQQAQPDYRLGPGDLVRITVYQSPELTLEARITDTGLVSYPLLGALQLGGRTVGQVEALIAEGLRAGKFVRDPQVSVLLQQVRGNQASVLGQVNKPGRFPLEQANMRLTDLVALAGGVMPTGADAMVLVGQRSGQPYRVEVDLPSVFRPNAVTENPVVLNGDVIYVERSPQVYIYGEVQKPGAMRLERGMTVMQGLATGGGLTLRGTERAMRVHRKGPDGRTQVIEPRLDDPLRDGDVIYVRESIF
jgi:polysaccharide biosynthesis/export protein